MINNWIKFLENKKEDNIIFNSIDFGIPKYMLGNILLDITDEFPDMHIDYMSIDRFITYYYEASSGDITDDFADDLKSGNDKFAIVIDKPIDNTDTWSYKKTVYELEPKIWHILDNIDGVLSMYNLRIWDGDFFYADTEYYIIIEKTS